MGLDPDRRGLGHPSRGQREHGRGRARARHRARQGSCAPIRSSPSAARAPCTPGTWDASSKVPRVLVPFGAGAMSAYGLLAAPLAFDFVRTASQRLDAADWAQINRLYEEMEAEGRAVLARRERRRRTRCAYAARPRCATRGRARGRGRAARGNARRRPASAAITARLRGRLPRALQPHVPWACPSRRSTSRVVVSGPVPDISVSGAKPAARPRRRHAGTEGHAQGVFPGSGRLRGHAGLRPLCADAGRGLRRTRPSSRSASPPRWPAPARACAWTAASP